MKSNLKDSYSSKMNLDGVTKRIIKSDVYPMILSNDEVGVGLGTCIKTTFHKKIQESINLGHFFFIQRTKGN
jgi:hypothetical protein